jgi:hypothetical protein
MVCNLPHLRGRPRCWTLTSFPRPLDASVFGSDVGCLLYLGGMKYWIAVGDTEEGSVARRCLFVFEAVDRNLGPRKSNWIIDPELEYASGMG